MSSACDASCDVRVQVSGLSLTTMDDVLTYLHYYHNHDVLTCSLTVVLKNARRLRFTLLPDIEMDSDAEKKGTRSFDSPLLTHSSKWIQMQKIQHTRSFDSPSLAHPTSKWIQMQKIQRTRSLGSPSLTHSSKWIQMQKIQHTTHLPLPTRHRNGFKCRKSSVLVHSAYLHSRNPTVKMDSDAEKKGTHSFRSPSLTHLTLESDADVFQAYAIRYPPFDDDRVLNDPNTKPAPRELLTQQ
jgi:hypothetical protein